MQIKTLFFLIYLEIRIKIFSSRPLPFFALIFLKTPLIRVKIFEDSQPIFFWWGGGGVHLNNGRSNTQHNLKPKMNSQLLPVINWTLDKDTLTVNGTGNCTDAGFKDKMVKIEIIWINKYLNNPFTTAGSNSSA